MNINKSLIVFGLLLFCLPLFSQNDIPAPSLTGDDWNQTSSISFDLGGNILGLGKSYFNFSGKVVQQQRWDMESAKVWAGMTLYDSQGRSAFQTLSAPVPLAPFALSYYEDFIKSSNGEPYDITDFDIGGTVSNPSTVSTLSSLGHYYSLSNTDNPYQDVTSYPFARSIFSRLNPGAVHKVLGGNKQANEWKQSYSFSMPSGTELSAANAFGPNYDFENYRITKTIFRDVHGVDTVTFMDSDGNMIAAARSGQGGPHSTNVLKMGVQGYVDIHIPQGINSFSIANPNPTVSGNLHIYDLINEDQIATVSGGGGIQNVSNGFYRISVSNQMEYADYAINNPGVLITISHQVNYNDYSLNYFDKTGRLLTATQPLNQNLQSTYSYNSLGQLLETTSPDEGTAEFLYRKDGQIRFSQNSNQALTGVYSYTRYDTYGRPIESGVYDGPVSFSQAAALVDNPSVPDCTTGDCYERTHTEYDMPDPNMNAFMTSCGYYLTEGTQQFVAGNISKTYTQNPETSTTWYSYDVQGRVTWIVQDIYGMGCLKTIHYRYDPATGNVAEVDYQQYDPTERLVHHFEYNARGQLIAAGISHEGLYVIPQAAYTYAETGELIRTVLAENLQGIDYVYKSQTTILTVS